ncbi:[protein-PII] uridylyltransferase [Desulfacinum hydrothermale DSM 13146]|uniref:Bifunctional uridylyltransferase/uridylyl-removing enzyme n=1 Tax=Desulfacinum hydrothermale DSM 13146 TaxID=1121390 RepID=A0A1W1XTG5_9BACT|nr:HD domain-containing protein [Desulfacinum hydrothermale]SMC27142.1 [protein-PII] uridylyltransferase [Desulfacinum hydrothermale DSM 13146]
MENMVESLKRQREQILQGADEQMLRRHMSLLEIAIMSLHNRLVNRLDADSEKFRSSGAIAALGALARGFLGPQDTVSLLWLRTEAFPWEEDWQEDILEPLREAGWDVQLRVASLPQVLEEAGESPELFFQLLEARYLSGNRELLVELDDALDELVTRRQEQLFSNLYEGLRRRQARLSQPDNWLEPDLLESPGGLHDIDTIRFASRVLLGVRCVEDAIFQGYLTRWEADRLEMAEKNLHKWLGLVRAQKGGRASVLDFHVQEVLAEKLGYSGRAGFLPVETFMQEVHRTFHDVFRVSSEFCERLQETGKLAEMPLEGPSFSLEDGISVVHGRIQVDPSHYEPTASNILHLFVLAAEKRLGFSSSTRRWILHHKNAVDSASEDHGVRDAFLDLLRKDGPALAALRRFSDYGLLQALIPETALVHGLVQHDAFHVYPVHEHHLRTVREIKRILRGDYQDEEPEITGLARGLADKTWLYLAALLHDIGKHAGRDHARAGADMFPVMARRLKLDKAGSERVAFLIRHHLLLMDTASMRDLGDMEMLLQCARTVGEPDRLQELLVLTLADMMATGPKAQQKWRETPVWDLYERLLYLLEKGEPSEEVLADRVERIKDVVLARVAEVVDRARLEEHFSQLPPRYLLSIDAEEMAAHLRLEMQLGEAPDAFVWDVRQENGTVAITVVSREVPGLLARAAGILTLHHLDIRDARVFTKKNGVVLLLFRCLQEEAADSVDWSRVQEDMGRLLEGKLALDYRISAHAAAVTESRRQAVPKSDSQVDVDNDSAREYTILEVYTADRPGLLYTITRTLLELHLRIYVAKITTKVDQVADIFYVKNHRGEKVTDPDQIQELRRALLFWLDGPGR